MLANIDNQVTRKILRNIDGVSQGIFYLLTLAALLFFAYGLYKRIRLWKSGQPSSRPLAVGSVLKRFVNHVLLQRANQRERPRAGRAHLLLFGGFAVLFVGTVLIAIEHYSALMLGRTSGNPIFHKGLYFVIYEFVLDTAGLALLAGCIWFLHRRLRGNSSMAHATGDFLVLGLLVSLTLTGYVAEGLRITVEQTPLAGFSYVGLLFSWILTMAGVTAENAEPLHFTLWWLHAVLALGFIAVFPYTRLLHSIAGAMNLVTADKQMGILQPVRMEQVEATGLVGVEKITDFTRWQLLSLDACVSCGRCEDLCPAKQSGKSLSPRDVVQDLQIVLSTAGKNDSAAVPLAGVISADAVWACTTCHACVDTCPLGVDPLTLITDMRRNLIAEGKLRGAPATSLQKMSRSGNPWGLPGDQRLDWAAGLDIRLAKDHPDFEVLYWVGCAASYDRRIQKVARAVVQLLQAADVDFVVLGPEERCTGESARRMGDEFLFQQLAEANLGVLSGYPVKKIVTHCPHCLNSFKHDYPQFYAEFGMGADGGFQVVHHTQFLSELITDGRLMIPKQAQGTPGAVGLQTYHDPCYLARVNGITESPRELIQLTLPGSQSEQFVELSRCGADTACCGAGGGRMWFDDAAENRTGNGRIAEVVQSQAKTVTVSCPFCLTMMSDGLAASGAQVQVKDIAELLLEALG